MSRSLSLRVLVVLGLALSVGLAAAVSPFASASPDGLERVADDHGFLERGEVHAAQERSPIPDYAFPGIRNEKVATGVAGFVGTLGVFAFTFALGRLVRRRRWAPSALTPST